MKKPERHTFNDRAEHVVYLCDACHRLGLAHPSYEELRAILFASLDKAS